MKGRKSPTDTALRLCFGVEIALHVVQEVAPLFVEGTGFVGAHRLRDPRLDRGAGGGAIGEVVGPDGEGLVGTRHECPCVARRGPAGPDPGAQLRGGDHRTGTAQRRQIGEAEPLARIAGTGGTREQIVGLAQQRHRARRGGMVDTCGRPERGRRSARASTRDLTVGHVHAPPRRGLTTRYNERYPVAFPPKRRGTEITVLE